MSSHRIEFDCQCGSCGATGLYVGLAERGGAAVVCHSCNGTGKVHRVVEWCDFEERKRRPDVSHVFEVNPGICIGEGNGLTLPMFGGMPFEDWFNGKPFPPRSENRKFTCPAWWYQSADYKKKPDWQECWRSSVFSSCPSFGEKHKCWERFDSEQKAKGDTHETV